MAKYRKKPIVVEAEQFVAGKISMPKGVWRYEDKYYIDTLEGTHIVMHGDWIITGIKGEKYPCKQDIFEMTYDLVEE